MKAIAEILRAKGSEVYTISPQATAHDAVVELDARRVGALLVVSGSDLVGMVTERDCLSRMILPGKSAKTVKVEEIMTREVIHVKPTFMVSEAMALMTEKRIRHLPVIEDGKLCGMVSLGDLVKATIADQAFLIHELEFYIANEQG